MSTKVTTVNLVDSYSSAKPGMTFNEDRIGTAMQNRSGSAWVLDGATGFKPDERLLKSGGSDAEWYAAQMNEIFMTNICAGQLERDERGFYHSSISEARRSFRRNAFTPLNATERCMLPSAAGLVMNYSADTRTLAFSGLGDCIGIVKIDGYNEPYLTHPSFLEEEKRRKEMKAKGHYSTEDRRMLRNRMNTNGGYWILSVHPEAARHIVHEEFTIPEGRGAQILIMSDGLDRATQLLNLQPLQLVEMARTYGLERLTYEVRQAEQRLGPSGTRQLGFSKQHDDVSGVYLEITPD